VSIQDYYCNFTAGNHHADLCKPLAAEGYHVLSLPAVLGNAVTLLKCLELATKEMDIPNGK
jgi:hypothetical protein